MSDLEEIPKKPRRAGVVREYGVYYTQLALTPEVRAHIDTLVKDEVSKLVSEALPVPRPVGLLDLEILGILLCSIIAVVSSGVALILLQAGSISIAILLIWPVAVAIAGTGILLYVKSKRL